MLAPGQAGKYRPNQTCLGAVRRRSRVSPDRIIVDVSTSYMAPVTKSDGGATAEIMTFMTIPDGMQT